MWGWFLSADDWSSDMEERFLRGVYCFWLYGHFFAGCYLEPFVVERGRLEATVPHDEEGYDFEDYDCPETIERYPLFILDLESDMRRKHVERLFVSFIAKLVHDGEERGEHEHATERLKTPRYGPVLQGQRAMATFTR
jgi:hypothetical protein